LSGALERSVQDNKRKASGEKRTLNRGGLRRSARGKFKKWSRGGKVLSEELRKKENAREPSRMVRKSGKAQVPQKRCSNGVQSSKRGEKRLLEMPKKNIWS